MAADLLINGNLEFHFNNKKETLVQDQANLLRHIQPRKIFLKMEQTFDCKFIKGTKVLMTSSTTVFPIKSHLDMKNIHTANVLLLFI